MDSWFRIDGTQQYLVVFSGLDIIFPDIKLCSVTLLALVEPLGILASPVLRQVTELLEHLLNTVDKLVCKSESDTDGLRVPTETEASLHFRVDNHWEEGVHLKLVKGDNELVVEEIVEVHVGFDLGLSLEVRLPLELVVLDDRRIRLGRLTVKLFPFPADS